MFRKECLLLDLHIYNLTQFWDKWKENEIVLENFWIRFIEIEFLKESSVLEGCSYDKPDSNKCWHRKTKTISVKRKRHAL